MARQISSEINPLSSRLAQICVLGIRFVFHHLITSVQALHQQVNVFLSLRIDLLQFLVDAMVECGMGEFKPVPKRVTFAGH